MQEVSSHEKPWEMASRAAFTFWPFVSFPESSNKTDDIYGNPYEANIGKSRYYKDKVIYQRKLNMFLNMFYKGEVA